MHYWTQANYAEIELWLHYCTHLCFRPTILHSIRAVVWSRELDQAPLLNFLTLRQVLSSHLRQKMVWLYWLQNRKRNMWICNIFIYLNCWVWEFCWCLPISDNPRFMGFIHFLRFVCYISEKKRKSQDVKYGAPKSTPSQRRSKPVVASHDVT